MKKIGEIIILVLFICQTITLTISYLNYETVIDLKLKNRFQDFPSYTVCTSVYNESMSKNCELIIDAINRHIKCGFSKNSITYNCSELSRPIVSKTPYASFCITYLSESTEEFAINKSRIFAEFIIKSIKLGDLNITRFKFNVHRTKTPPHIFSDSIHLRSGMSHIICINAFHEILLPFPYETDCQNYDILSEVENGPKSQEDCITKYMMRKEFEECKCHNKWFYSYVDNPKTTFCNKNSCHIRLRANNLEKICKKNCINRYYTTSIKFIYKISGGLQNIKVLKSNNYEIIYVYSPKMSFIEYLCGF